jgi:drug/metabolite transporter (DMT)-like permease
MGATTYLVPPITILLGWLLLGESPAPLAYGGGLLCLAGVAISRYRRRAVAAMPAVSVDSPDSKPLSKS